jgi:Domain of unknown function (DUF5658)
MLPLAVRALTALSCVVLAWLTIGSAVLLAQDPAGPSVAGVDDPQRPDAIVAQTQSDLVTPSRLALPAAWMIEPPGSFLRAEVARPVRPNGTPLTPALTSLYVSFVTLQVLDAHSTLSAVRHGAREMNPLVATFADRPAALVALKAGTAAGVLYMTERVRRRSRVGALLMMVAFNSAYATVVANNYSIARELENRR